MKFAKLAIFRLFAWVFPIFASKCRDVTRGTEVSSPRFTYGEMSVSSDNSSTEEQFSYDEVEDEDVSTNNDDEEDMLGVADSMGTSPYQFEPYATVDDSAVDRDSDEDDEGPVWRLNSTNW